MPIRVIFAFLGAPLLAAAILPFVVHTRLASEQPMLAVFVFYALLLATQLTLGLPLRLIFARSGRASWSTHLLIGIVMTAVPFSALCLWGHFAVQVPLARSARLVATFAGAGAATGLLYWLLAAIGTPAQRHRRHLAELNQQFD